MANVFEYCDEPSRSATTGNFYTNRLCTANIFPKELRTQVAVHWIKTRMNTSQGRAIVEAVSSRFLPGSFPDQVM
jgi:hypothetical protein